GRVRTPGSRAPPHAPHATHDSALRPDLAGGHAQNTRTERARPAALRMGHDPSGGGGVPSSRGDSTGIATSTAGPPRQEGARTARAAVSLVPAHRAQPFADLRRPRAGSPRAD